MLKIANAYEKELRQLLAEASVDPRYMFYFTQPSGGYFDIELNQNTVWAHHFVSLNKNGKVIGYLSYRVDAFARSVNNFGLISFDIGNQAFLRDTYDAIADIFEKYRMNRLEWSAVVDNPVTKSYRRVCQQLGGRECSYERQAVQLLDGKLHDSVSFEVLADEYFSSQFYKRRMKRKGVDVT